MLLKIFFFGEVSAISANKKYHNQGKCMKYIF